MPAGLSLLAQRFGGALSIIFLHFLHKFVHHFLLEVFYLGELFLLLAVNLRLVELCEVVLEGQDALEWVTG